MNWKDERWVRLYTRDTVTWSLLGWQARTVLLHLLRKVDRSGVLDLGGESAEDAVCAMTALPPEVVGPGLERLVAKKTVTLRDDQVVIPNFVEAQEAKQSDASRARAYRERRRDGVTRPSHDVEKRDATVTPRDATVTARHSASHGVTTRLDKTRVDKTGVVARAPDPPPTPPAEPVDSGLTPPAGPAMLGHDDPDDPRPGFRCWKLLDAAAPGTFGDWWGAQRHCARIEQQARALAADGKPWEALLSEVVTAFVERQRERDKPLVVRYLAADFAEIAQKLAAPAKRGNFGKQVQRAYELRERLLRLDPDNWTEAQKAKAAELKPLWQKYKNNGHYYDRLAEG